jgi:hypothetical protein
MGGWLSYSLSDFLLFSPRTYYRLFELYNRAIWPGQVLAVALGLAVLGLARRGGAWRGRAAAAALAACWLWVAWAYLLERYDTINWTARYFAAGFVTQALLLVWAGVLRGRLRFRPDEDVASRAGLSVLLFALAVQPLVGLLAEGRTWRAVEVFGMTPDPTVVATLGLLLTTAGRVRWELLVLPLLWCAISGATAWAMAARDALVMPLAAVVSLGLAAWRTVSRSRQAARTGVDLTA